MNKQDAKKELKKSGLIYWRGCKIAETYKQVGNDREYTGRYAVTKDGELIGEQGVSADEALNLALGEEDMGYGRERKFKSFTK